MQITPLIHAIRVPFTIPHPSGVPLDRFVYMYFLETEPPVLIDSGVAGSERILGSYLLPLGRTRSEIGQILHTHAHPDHIGATRAIREASGCRIAIHRRERSWLEDVDLQERERPVPGFGALVGGSVPVDDPLEGGECLSLGDLHLQVLSTPGHSPGSLSFLLVEERALFCGDLVPRTGDLPIYDDPRASITSLRRLQEIPDLRILLSSWDEPRYGEAVYKTIEEGVRYIEQIDGMIREIAGNSRPDPREWTGHVLNRLHFPPNLMNPLLVRTIEGHMRYLSMSPD